jgi:outer membrane protein, heavy metal efflux system
MKMIRLVFKSLPLSALLLLARLSAPAQVLPLDSVLATVQQYNPMLQEYEWKAKANDAYVGGANSWMPPQVGAGVFMTPYRRVASDAMGVGGNEGEGSVMIQVEQMIPHPAKQRAKREYLAAQSAVERSGQNYRFNQLRAEAKKQYFEWVVLEKRKSVLRENEEIIRFMIRLAEVRYPYNQSKLNSIYDAQAQLARLQNETLMIKGQIRQRQVGLNTLMNRSPQAPLMVDTTLTLNQQVLLPVDTVSLASRSDIEGLDRSIQVMRLNVQQEKAMLKPDFGIQYGHMQSMGEMPNQFTLMGMMTIPLAPWSAKMNRANVKAMNYEIEAMRRERAGVLNEAAGMLVSWQIEIETGRQQLQNFEQSIIPALRKNYEVTLRAYEQNTAELPLVISAWEKLNMTQMEYLDKLNELLQMQVMYEKELEK